MNVSKLGALAAVVTAVGVSMAACGGSTTNNNAVQHSSHVGESCLTTADCIDPNVCVSNVCVAGPGSDGGASSSGGDASSSGGSSSGSASSSGGSSSGGTTVPEAAPPHLGVRGDSCRATSDCGPGLDCITFSSGSGVCDLASYGLSSTVTGKVCGGECNAASDCCELPVDTFTVGANLIHHCSDLDAIIGTSSCPANGDVTPLGQACFLKNAYCGSCGANWTCTANLCIYSAACSQGNTGTSPGVGGCAPWSRLSNGLTTACNPTTNKCAGTTSTTGCSTDTDCTGTGYINFTGTSAGICKAPNGSGGDCTCQGHACYLACSKDLDCAIGYSCDVGSGSTNTRTCKPVGSCTSDTQCIEASNNVLSTCSSGKCVTPCSSDHDCSKYSGTTIGTGGFNGDVCVIPSGKTTGTCQSIYNNCSSDSDCNIPGGATPHTFCISSSSSAATTYYSAITN